MISEMAHTSKWVCSKEGEIRSITTYENGETCNSYVFAKLVNRTRHNRKHARLICAVPDLLAVCISLVKWCDKNPPAGDALYFVHQARLAIVKATGGEA